jgi:hypothetical protein
VRLPSQGRSVAGAHHAEHGYHERKRQAELQCDGEAQVSGDDHHAVGACMCEVQQIIVEEGMDHPLIGRPVSDEMGFVASQHLGSVRDKFHLHDFSHIGEELLDMKKQPLSALSTLVLKPTGVPEFIDDLPNVLPLAN